MLICFIMIFGYINLVIIFILFLIVFFVIYFWVVFICVVVEFIYVIVNRFIIL